MPPSLNFEGSSGWIEPRIVAADAEALLARSMTPRWKGIFRAARRFLAARRLALPLPPLRTRLELVFLPCAALTHAGPAAVADSPLLLINGYAAQVDVVRAALADAAPVDEAVTFPFPLSEAEVMEIAREFLLKARLGRNLVSPHSGAIAHWHRLIQYPFWVRYEKARTIRFEILDARTGRLGGTLVRHGFIKALHRKLELCVCF